MTYVSTSCSRLGSVKARSWPPLPTNIIRLDDAHSATFISCGPTRRMFDGSLAVDRVASFYGEARTAERRAEARPGQMESEVPI